MLAEKEININQTNTRAQTVLEDENTGLIN